MFPLIFALILNPSASTLACPLPSHHSLQSRNCSTDCDRTTGTCLHNVSLNAFVIICTLQIYSLVSTSCYMSSNLLTWKRLCYLNWLPAPQIQCFMHFHVLSHRIANLSLKDIFTNKSPKATIQEIQVLGLVSNRFSGGGLIQIQNSNRDRSPWCGCCCWTSCLARLERDSLMTSINQPPRR